MIFLLTHIIDKAAERDPDQEAFRFYDQSLTYAELVQRANGLAQVLIDQGVKRGDRVGIYMHKCLESAIAVYGIMKAGAVYVPLDPLMPLARLEFIIRDCHIRKLITQSTKQDTLQQLIVADTGLDCLIGLPTWSEISLRTFSWEEVYQRSTSSVPQIRLIEQDMSYIMYTSGSTGEPKGIIHTHHSGLSYAKLSADLYALNNADRLANFAPLHFDQSTFEYFSGPLVGATTVIIPEEYTKFPASLSKLIADERITIWYSVPFALIQLLLHGVLADRDLSSLRWVLFGGEPFPPKHLRELMKHWPQAGFSNVYGPAEVNQCTFYHVPSLWQTGDDSLPIGSVWSNTEALVIDAEDRVVERGQVGELLIRTPTMMQGYWGRSDLNQRAFFDYSQVEGFQQIFYRTGDLVQLQPDGYYRFLGRKDRQIKTRGYRVELDEVEAALLSHQAVAEAAVFPLPDQDGSQTIEAAVTLEPEAEITAAALFNYLTSRLPRYALPANIEFRDNFPRTSSGKINRRELQTQVVR